MGGLFLFVLNSKGASLVAGFTVCEGIDANIALCPGGIPMVLGAIISEKNKLKHFNNVRLIIIKIIQNNSCIFPVRKWTAKIYLFFIF